MDDKPHGTPPIMDASPIKQDSTGADTRQLIMPFTKQYPPFSTSCSAPARATLILYETSPKAMELAIHLIKGSTLGSFISCNFAIISNFDQFLKSILSIVSAIALLL